MEGSRYGWGLFLEQTEFLQGHVLVAGDATLYDFDFADSSNKTAQIFQTPRDDNDQGAWIFLAHPLTRVFGIFFSSTL